MVFQHFNLWSHLAVLENVIEAPIHMLGLSRAEALLRGEKYLQQVDLREFTNVYPAQLSGGQQRGRLPGPWP